jgi:hypothetical protein
MSLAVATAVEAIKEYSFGIFPDPAVKWLEKRYGTAWRKGSRSKFYIRRAPLFFAYERMLAERKHSETDIIKRLEILRLKTGTLRSFVKRCSAQERDLLLYLEREF